MNEFDTFLRQSLDDLRLSRAERKALRGRIDDLNLSDADRTTLRSHAFSIAREHAEVHDDGLLIDWLEEVSKALDSPQATYKSSAYFSPGEKPRDAIIGLIGGANQRIDICVFTITDNQITDAIIDAYRRGVQVQILTDNDKSEDRGSDIDRLAEIGITVFVDRTDKHMHHKFAIFDRTTLLTGSYNWTRSAAEFNEENILVTDDPRLVEPFMNEFTKLLREFSAP